MSQHVDSLTYLAIGAFLAIMLFEWGHRFRRYVAKPPQIGPGHSGEANSVPDIRVAEMPAITSVSQVEPYDMKRPLVLWLAAGSVLTWWSGYGFGTRYGWNAEWLNVSAAFGMAIVPALVFEAVVNFWESLPPVCEKRR